MLRRVLPIVLIAMALLGPSAPAQAFCRTTTETPKDTGCPLTCFTGGLPLFWPRPEIHYVVNASGFPDLPDARVREVLQQSFGVWQAVRCDEDEIGFDLRLDDGTTELKAGPREVEPDRNVIVRYEPDEWAARDLSSAAFAITAVWYEVETGRLRDADMQFNGGRTFAVCPEDGCPPGVVDLRNVATHEAGHFLGLSHSPGHPEATMWCTADAADRQKQTLADDDVEGLCAAYPPGKAFAEEHRSPSRCAAVPGLRGSSARGMSAALMLVLASVLARRLSKSWRIPARARYLRPRR